MLDHTKRKTLKVLAATATVAAVPGVVQAALPTSSNETNISAVTAHLQNQLHARGISLDIVPSPEHPSMWVRFTNGSNASVELDHVSPCLIRSANRLYDINSGLVGNSRRIEPNQSCTFLIEAI